MKTAYLVLNDTGQVIATHLWGSDNEPEFCPIQPPLGGQLIKLDAMEAGPLLLLAIVNGGQRLRFQGDTILVEEEPIGVINEGKVILDQ